MAPTSLFLPGKSHGQRSLLGYNAWGDKELDMTSSLAYTHETKLQSLPDIAPEPMPYSKFKKRAHIFHLDKIILLFIFSQFLNPFSDFSTN